MEQFKVGDRVVMGYGRGWKGVVIALSTAYPAVKIVTVRWDNNKTQTINTDSMQLQLQRPERGN